MVAPLVVAVAISAATALAQDYQRRKAEKASQKELDKIRQMWDSLVPPNLDMSITDPPELIRQMPSLPNFDMSKITPEIYKVVAKYEPQAAEVIKEVAPQVVKASAQGEEGRKAQVEALRKMKQVEELEGKDPEFMSRLDDAAKRSQIEAQSRQASILQDAARRGTMGSGAALAAQLSGQEQAMSEGAAASRQAAVEAYKNHLMAMRESGQMGRQLSQDDLSLQQTNADIINAFNQRTSARAQEQANLATSAYNEANRYNTGMAQDIANRNIDESNKALYQHQQNKNELAGQLYNIGMGQTQYQNQLAQSLADWKSQQKQLGNQNLQQKFANETAIIGGKTGVGNTAINMGQQTAQAKAQAIQGVGDAAQSGAMYYQNQKQKEDLDEKDNPNLDDKELEGEWA